MKSFLATVVSFTLMLIVVSGQEPCLCGHMPCPPNVPCNRITRFHEYGNIRYEDERAVLDHLATQLRNSPDSIAYFLIYAGQKACIDEAKKRALRARKYLITKHGIKPDRIFWKDGGFRPDLSTEIWILPVGSDLPKPYPNLDRAGVQILKKCQLK